MWLVLSAPGRAKTWGIRRRDSQALVRAAAAEELIVNVGDVASRRRRNNVVKRHNRRRKLILLGSTEFGCARLKVW